MGMHSSHIGKFIKKDPNHGWLWNKIKSWLGFEKCCKDENKSKQEK